LVGPINKFTGSRHCLFRQVSWRQRAKQAEMERRGYFPLDRTKFVFLSVVVIAFTRVSGKSMVWAWGNQGHAIVAIIAADNLVPVARARAAKILRMASEVDLLETAMVSASVRPDTEFREADRSTVLWHYIDRC
jgi:hypothetical protein